MSQELIARRHLVLQSRDTEKIIEVRIYKPIPIHNDWAAAFEIDDFASDGSVYRHQAIHIDSLGAVIQAIDLLTSKLRSSKLFSSMHWLEQGDECGLRRLGD
jgi:hypothetical protein